MPRKSSRKTSRKSSRTSERIRQMQLDHAYRQSHPPIIDQERPTKLNRRQLGEHVARLISDDRNATHGDPHFQFSCAQDLEDVISAFFHSVQSTSTFSKTQKESMDMILTKLLRLACGSNLQDHWLDIAGYALIAAETAEKPL